MGPNFVIRQLERKGYCRVCGFTIDPHTDQVAWVPLRRQSLILCRRCVSDIKEALDDF